MTHLCLDLGERRIGVAISDPSGTIARPLTTLRGGGDAVALARQLRPLIEEHEVGEVVIGLPRRMDGAHGPEAEKAEALARELAEQLTLPIQMWDERLSTVEATRRMIESGVRRSRRKQVVDQIAATLILQGYLDAPSEVRP